MVCATDEIAAGAMKYLRERGIIIGRDMLLTGQGDSVLAANVSPSLTTIRFYYEKCGEESANMILERIEQGRSFLRELKLGYELVEQESTGK